MSELSVDREFNGNSTPRALVEAVFRHRRIIWATAVAIFVCTFLFLAFAKREYESRMELLVRNARPDYLIAPGRTDEPAARSAITEEAFNSELAILKSTDVAARVVDDNWARHAPATLSSADLKSREKAVANFQKHLTIEAVPKTNVLRVTYRDRDPNHATETLQRLLAVYLARHHELDRASSTSSFFRGEAEQYKKDLDQAQRELAKFQQENGIISLPDSEKSLEDQLAELTAKLRATKVQLSDAVNRLLSSEIQLRTVKQRVPTQQRAVPHILSIEQLTTMLATYQNQRTAFLTRYPPTDRLVQEVDQQIANTTAALQKAKADTSGENTTDVNPLWQQLQAARAQSETDLRALRAARDEQSQQVDQLQAKLKSLAGSAVEYNTLHTRVVELQNDYQTYSQKRGETRMADAMDEQQLVNVAISESPTYSLTPASPRPLLLLAGACLLCVFLAGCGVFFAEMGRDTVAAPYELETFVRRPVLATIPLAASKLGSLPRFDSEFRDSGGRQQSREDGSRVLTVDRDLDNWAR